MSLVKHHRRAQKEDRSHAGEYAHLKELVSRLRIDGGYIVDLGASDGVNYSCTLGFFRKPKWSGLAVELSPLQFSRLAHVYTEFSGTQLALCRITPDNVSSLLAAHEVPRQFTLLNLDIDSYEQPVIESILLAGYRPQIISIEISPSIPPPIYFVREYADDFDNYRGVVSGCSLTAAVETIKPHGYRLEALQYNNAIFVLDSLCDDAIEDLDAIRAYNAGFRDKPDRQDLFPWLGDMKNVFYDKPEDVLARLKERCESGGGPYTLRMSINS